MFISPRFQVIFIHIQRTGGYSIHDIFRQHDPDLIESIPVDAKKQRVRHCYAEDIQAAIPSETFNTYRKFCVVRHPYARMLSWYRVLSAGYGKDEPRFKAETTSLKLYQAGIHALNRYPNAMSRHLANSWTHLFRKLNQHDPNASLDLMLRGENTGNRVLVEVNRHAQNFSDFLHLSKDQADGLFERFHANQFDYIADPSNPDAVLADDILRFENLDGDFNRFAETIGFPARLEHLNSSKPSTNKTVDDANLNIIRERFKKDFQYFDYAH